MTNQTETSSVNHNIIIENRKKLTLSGVTDSGCFDESSVNLFTKLGELTIRGKNLKVLQMSVETGEAEIEGEIRSVCYGDINRTKKLNLFEKVKR